MHSKNKGIQSKNQGFCTTVFEGVGNIGFSVFLGDLTNGNVHHPMDFSLSLSFK